MIFRNVPIKIVTAGPKWTSIMYPESSARSRIRTSRLMEDAKSGKVKVLNPELLPVVEMEH
ncbi:MAG: hypothetical protein HKN09_08885 [Saprospiraceae bacterium]|nr:hypothetical protein [Saprospiraceae bacterium]